MPTERPSLALDAAQLNEFLRAAFPESESSYGVEHADLAGIRMRLPHDRGQLRPGGTISGPTMMSLADAAAWLVTLSRIGPARGSVDVEATDSSHQSSDSDFLWSE